MRTVVIDYGAGNVESVVNALSLIGAGNEIFISSNPSEIKTADHLILPGVGAFADCMNGLKAVEGLLPELRKQVLIEKKPFLGICVGMQLFSDQGFEEEVTKGFGWIKGYVKKIELLLDMLRKN